MVRQFAYGLLSVLVLIGGTGVSISGHYCQDELRQIRVFWKSHSCHTAEAACKKTCCYQTPSGNDAEEDRNCCSDETQYVDANLDYFYHATPSLEQVDWVGPTTAFPTYPLLTISSRADLPNVYRPPPIIRDRVVIHQSFLC